MLAFVSPGLAQETPINLNRLVEETQKVSEDASRVTLVWWIPEEFWWASGQGDPTVSPRDTEEMIRVLSPYIMIGAVDGTLGSFGGVTYVNKENLLSRISIIGREGVRYTPIPEEELDPDARVLVSVFRPILASMLGGYGENFHFFLFPANDAAAGAIAAAGERGEFSVVVGDEVYTFRLPLGAVLPPKFCPIDGEKLSGAWTYCPWHGATLVDEKPKN